MPEKPWLPPSMQQPKPARVDWRPVSVTYAAKQWNANWEVKDGKVHVFGAYGSAYSPLRGRPAEDVAPVLLIRLVKAWMAR